MRRGEFSAGSFATSSTSCGRLMAARVEWRWRPFDRTGILPGTSVARAVGDEVVMNVLLPIDESTCSEAAVDAVLTGFCAEETVVRVLHVIEWPHGLPPALTFAEGPRAADCVLAAHEDIRRRASALVDRAVARLQEAQFLASACVVEGDARHTILDMAADWPADAIVIGSHGRTRLDRILLGSVSEGVARRAMCPVQVIREPALGTVASSQVRATRS